MANMQCDVSLIELAGEQVERDLEIGLRQKSEHELVDLMESLQVIFHYVKQQTNQ